MTDRAPRLMSCGCVVPYGMHCQHFRDQRAAADRRRPNARARGYDSKWERESKAFLAMPGNDRCACGCGRVADMVDHKVAHKGDKRLFWSRSNWQPFNLICNRRKAVREEGALGRHAVAGAPSETFLRDARTDRGQPCETPGHFSHGEDEKNLLAKAGLY